MQTHMRFFFGRKQSSTEWIPIKKLQQVKRDGDKGSLSHMFKESMVLETILPGPRKYVILPRVTFMLLRISFGN